MKKKHRIIINKLIDLFIKKRLLTKGAAIFLLLGISIGVLWEETIGIGTWHSYHPSTDKLNVCFTPPSGCGDLIANEIVKASRTVYMQAYGLTSQPIIHQLINAKKRGVMVQVLLDGGNLSDNKDIASTLKKEGVVVYIDNITSGIAHNKVIVIDALKVITGSFNFTTAADKKNAENVLLIEDKEIAKTYLANWEKRRNKSLLH